MASANPSADDYVGFYLDRPTEKQLDELEALRAHALDHPLEPGNSLSWQGPNLHPESLPPADYPRPTTPLPSPHEPRPLLAALLAHDSPAQSGRGWSLRLVDGLQTGADQWSQVWRCEAVDGQGREVGRVVLKLYHQALFRFPDGDEWPDVEQEVFFRWPARHAEACESRAYRDLSAYQGRDVPFCYGFYMFRLPDGNDVVGVVLEDLVDKVVPFAKLVEDPTTAQRGTYEQVAELAYSAFELHRRVTECGILHVAKYAEDLHQLKGSWSCIIATGFGHPLFLDRAREVHRRTLERERAQGPLEPWAEIFCALSNSQVGVRSTVEELFRAMGHDFRRWRDEERAQERLAFLEDRVL
ncbi:hypothetical protein JCM3775_005552 [Rhodotorula graminis]